MNEVLGWEGPVTYRQYLAWQAWFDIDANRPSKDNFYVMQIACEVRRVLSNNPKEISVNDFLLELKSKTPTPLQDSEELKKNKLLLEKAKWLAFVGGVDKVEFN